MTAITPWQKSLPVKKYVPYNPQAKCTWYCGALCKAITYPISSCKALLAKRSDAVRYSIMTLDHKSSLDALLINGKLKKIVLLSLGPDSNFEELRAGKALSSFLASLLQCLKQQLGDVHILIPSHPKTTQSNERRALEIQSCFDMLIKSEHFKPDDVLVYGHGIGALYGAKAASQIQAEYPRSKISVVIDRSSVDLHQAQEKERDESKGHVRRGTNINIQSGVEALKGTILAIMSKNDMTIPLECSFSKKANKDKFEDRYIPVNICKSSDEDAHFAKFTEQEANLVGGHLRDCLHLEKPEEVKNWTG